jgi:hydrogenase maturation protease
MKAAVIGIGNILYGDDGIGVITTNALMTRYRFSENCEIIDGGTKGIELLPIIEELDALILVDAVEFGVEPGEIKIIEDQNMKAYLDLKFSVHQIGIPDMLFAMEFKGIKPPKICLVGIQPDTLGFEMSLTTKVSDKLDELVEIIVERLEQWGVTVKTRDPEDVYTPSPEFNIYVPGNSIKDN